MSLLDKASLIVTPNAYKASKLYSVVPNTTLGDMDVVRATTSTRVNASGLIESVGLNIPRIDYTNGSCPSILVEPQRTNVILYSSDLSQTIWSKSNYILTPTSTIQGLIATRITKNAINNGVYNGTGLRNLINTVGTFAAGVKTLSFYIRKGNTDKVAFVINNILVGVSTSVNCEFNFNTKTFTNVAVGLTASFENYNTDVYKIILTINDIGVSTGKAIWIAPIDASNNTVDGGYLDFAFAQWELGGYPTSYIPTIASTVTRNADVISKTGITSLIGQTEGTVFLDFELLPNNINSSYLFALNDGTTTNMIRSEIYILSPTVSQFRTGVNTLGVGQGDYFTTITQLKNKMAISYSLNNVKIFINGVLVATDTSVTIPIMNTFNLGNRTSIDNIIGSNYKQVVFFKTQLTNAECITLTTL